MSGIDPELNLDGFTMASYHLERGCRNFIEVARLLALDLDCDMERLRPHLRAWFNGARDAMEDAGYDMSGASTADEVAAAMKCWNLWALADNR